MIKSCIRVPRVFLPRGDYENWAVGPCDRHPRERGFWQNESSRRAGKPSALFCFLPDAFLGEEDEARRAEAREAQYSLLEEGEIERLNCGMILVSRTTGKGLRHGIVAAVDLEEFSPSEKDAPIRATTETIPALVEARMKLREASVLEFPHTVLLYKDKKDKLLRALDDDWERLYDFELSAGGRLEGFFLPEEDARFAARELAERADPCFLVADGNHSLAAAKAYWEEIKTALSPAERRNHPARFHLCEFVNRCEESVVFEPVHRIVKEVEEDAFCDYFMRKFKCERKGRVLCPVLSDAESYRAVDRAIFEFLRQNFGKLEYGAGRPSLLAEDGVAVALPPVEAEDLVRAVKSGELYPAKSFRLGGEDDARYCLEGREISYD